MLRRNYLFVLSRKLSLKITKPKFDANILAKQKFILKEKYIWKGESKFGQGKEVMIIIFQ